MSVLDRSALSASPLADLHMIASELGLDGFRRLRKDDLIEAIVMRQGGEAAPATDEAPSVAVEEPAGNGRAPARSSARSGRSRRRRRDADGDDSPAVPASRGERSERGEHSDRSDRPDRSERSDRPDRSERSDRPDRSGGRSDRSEADVEERAVEGIVELLPNGSGFVRVSEAVADGGVPEPSEQDVYVSAAQVRRCELVTGDRVSGPQRAPRRSERYPSLVRVDTINDRPASEVGGGTRFDELPCAFPSERFAFDSEDPTLKALEWLTPLGKGSRAVIAGPARAGKTEALRLLANALATQEGLEISLVLAGVRPEEIADWTAGPVEPASAVSFAASPDAQGHAIENVLDQARRVAARGGDAVVLVDTLASLPAGAARRVLAAARNIVDGGSLTVIATAGEPVGGETTVVTLDRELTAAGRFPALDFVHSGTLRAELLVGEAGAEAIARARAQAVE